MAAQQGGGLLAAREHRVAQHRGQVAQVGLDSVDVRRVERRGELADRGVAGCAAHDDLGQHGIVETRDLGARFDPGVHSWITAGAPLR
jgi:hypothetical protein